MSAVHKSELVQSEAVPEKYSEPERIRLSKDDSVAFINSIRYPAKPNDLLKEVMRKHYKKS